MCTVTEMCSGPVCILIAGSTPDLEVPQYSYYDDTFSFPPSVGVIGTCKAVVSEVSDDNNQAIGVAVLASGVFTGFIAGPAVGGAIADPVGQYNLTITSEQVGVENCNTFQPEVKGMGEGGMTV